MLFTTIERRTLQALKNDYQNRQAAKAAKKREFKIPWRSWRLGGSRFGLSRF
jgi:hypothetical protein